MPSIVISGRQRHFAAPAKLGSEMSGASGKFDV